VAVASGLEWSKAMESCRAQQWSSGFELLSAAISAHGAERPALVARAICRASNGDESGAIVDICAALALPKLETDAAAFDQLAQSCGEGAVAQIMLLIKQEVAHSDIELRVQPLKPEKPVEKVIKKPSEKAVENVAEKLPEKDAENVAEKTPETFAEKLAEKSLEKPPATKQSSQSLAERWKQESAQVLSLVQTRSWREAEKMAQAFLIAVERTVPNRRISGDELSKLQTDVEALLMAVHCDHSTDLLKQGNPALALIFARRASDLLGPHQDSAHVVAVRTAAARAAITLPVVEEALNELEEASRHVKTRSERAEVGQLLAQLGDVARNQRVWILAISAYTLAADMYRQSGASDDSARVLALMLDAAARRISEQAAG
jgi:tetratricopeptide (TPR) repeat protein